MPTVQGLLMDACRRVLDEPVKVVGASRTDAGVHALRQVASLATSSSIAPAALGRALNALLPSAVRVVDARAAPPVFNARRSAHGKRYAYLIDRGPVADPFMRRYAWHPGFRLDPVAMRAAIRHVRGQHDFSSFCAAAGRGRSPVCTVRACRIVSRGRWLAIMVSADSFLHHMVRNLVGTLAEIGRGSRPAEAMAAILAARDRSRAGPTAPAEGLVLVRVQYDR
jgi:tRNA pseudouridine38-40 synthase